MCVYDSFDEITCICVCVEFIYL
ncbi:MAG: hypothetical protein EX285_02890 [Thaumarchaeota archaeon]|nr:hypothetical protein [Nitrososphaerota archaeon]